MRTHLSVLLLPLFLTACSRPAPVAVDAPPVVVPPVVTEKPAVETPAPVITVRVSYPGANAPMVNDSVATPLLQQINGIEGLARLESECRDDGTCIITVRFEPKTDLNQASASLQKRVAIAEPTLPEEVRRQGVTLHKGDPDRFPPLWVALTSPDKTHDALFLNNYATLRVKDEIAHVAGATSVRAVGRVDTVLRFDADPGKLASFGLTISDVVTAIEKQNIRVAAGQLAQALVPMGGPFPLTLTAAGRLTDIEQLNGLIVRTVAGGQVIHLKDVGMVERAHQADGFARVSGKPAALLAVRTQGQRSATDGVRKVIAELEKTAPKGLALQVVGDLTTDRSAAVELRLPDTASLQRTEDVVTRTEESLRGLHGLEECLSFADRETNVAIILVKLAANDTTTPADIRKALADIREAVVRVSDLSMGIPFPVRFALTGPEREKLLIWAQAVEREIRQDGVATDPDIYAARQVPKLQIMIDRKRLQELGVSAPDAYKLLHDSVGIDVAGFNQIGRSIFLPVTRDKARAKVDYLKGLFVKNERGEFVPLSTFIEFRQAMAATAVVSVDGNPALRITAAVSAGKTADDTTTRCVEMAKSLRAKLGLSADYKAVDLASTKPR